MLDYVLRIPVPEVHTITTEIGAFMTLLKNQTGSSSSLHYYKQKSEILKPPKYSKYFQKTEVDNPKIRIATLAKQPGRV